MICSRPIQNCPDCGDTLIHQTNRGPHESSSAFGQFVHDRVGIEMFWLDVDGASFKKKTLILRMIEHKPRGGSLSSGQNTVLPLLAKSLQLLAATGLVHEQSGVFVVYSDHPHDSALVEQIGGWKSRRIWPKREMTGPIWHDFIKGEVVDLDGDIRRRSA
jgi:hypothetical protein